MDPGIFAGRKPDDVILSRNQLPEATDVGGVQPGMGHLVEPVKPQGYLSQAADLVYYVGSAGFSIVSRSVSIVFSTVNWMIENRLGLAKFVGVFMVPSQVAPWLGKHVPGLFPGLRDFPDLQKSCQIISSAYTAFEGFRIAPFNIKNDSDSVNLRGVICYPQKWDPKDNSRCILYHNPNGCVLSWYFSYGSATYTQLTTPGQLQSLGKCPVIVYDYRGTGLNQGEGLWGYLPFSTYETVVQDGVAALESALGRFGHVYVAGSSLGGGVATASVARHLAAGDGQDDKRVELLTHDSFTTTARVVIPGRPRFADLLGCLVGGNLNAEAAMGRLIERRIKVVALNRREDHIIPRGARMSEFMASFHDDARVFSKTFEEEGWDDGHGVLNSGMKSYLEEING